MKIDGSLARKRWRKYWHRDAGARLSREVSAINARVSERARLLIIFDSERLYNCALGSARFRGGVRVDTDDAGMSIALSVPFQVRSPRSHFLGYTTFTILMMHQLIYQG